MNIVDRIGGQYNDVSRLLEFFARQKVGIGHAGDAITFGIF